MPQLERRNDSQRQDVVCSGPCLCARFALTRLDVLQLFFRAVVAGADAADEHLGEIVAGAHAHLADVRQCQLVALRSRQVFHLGGAISPPKCETKGCRWDISE